MYVCVGYKPICQKGVNVCDVGVRVSHAAEPDLFAQRFVEILMCGSAGNREPRRCFLAAAMWASRGFSWLTWFLFKPTCMGVGPLESVVLGAWLCGGTTYNQRSQK